MLRKRKTEKLMWILKALLASYIITGLLLLALSYVAFKLEMDEQMVVGIIVTIYVISTFTGGFIIGKLTKVKKYVWGTLVGAIYYGLLLAISYGVYREFGSDAWNIFTTMALCIGGGTFGGMIA